MTTACGLWAGDGWMIQDGTSRISVTIVIFRERRNEHARQLLDSREQVLARPSRAVDIKESKRNWSLSEIQKVTVGAGDGRIGWA